MNKLDHIHIAAFKAFYKVCLWDTPDRLLAFGLAIAKSCDNQLNQRGDLKKLVMLIQAV